MKKNRSNTLKRIIAVLFIGMLSLIGLAGPAQAMPWTSSHDGWCRGDACQDVDTVDIHAYGGWQADGSGQYLDRVKVWCTGSYDDPCINGYKLVIWNVTKDGSEYGSVRLNDIDVPRIDALGGYRYFQLGDRIKCHRCAAEMVGGARRHNATNKSFDIGDWVG